MSAYLEGNYLHVHVCTYPLIVRTSDFSAISISEGIIPCLSSKGRPYTEEPI